MSFVGPSTTYILWLCILDLNFCFQTKGAGGRMKFNKEVRQPWSTKIETRSTRILQLNNKATGPEPERKQILILCITAHLWFGFLPCNTEYRWLGEKPWPMNHSVGQLQQITLKENSCLTNNRSVYLYVLHLSTITTNFIYIYYKTNIVTVLQMFACRPQEIKMKSASHL